MQRPITSALAAACVTLLIPLAGTSATPAAAAAAPAAPSSAAVAAASWLGARLTPAGYLPSTTVPGKADLSGTVNTVLALVAAQVGATQVRSATAFLQAHVDQFVVVSGSDGPGQLGLLILAAHAVGADPHAFGGSDLVARLEATRTATGPDAGLFGAQDPTFDGAYRQGLALAGLAAAGVTDTAASTWLKGEQCPDGGWESYHQASAPAGTSCVATDSVGGEDSNSTALAVEGLAAQGATPAHDPVAFLTAAQGSDGGWSYSGGPSDADSTALVMQALIAIHQSPSKFVKNGVSPYARLLSFQNECTGAFAYQPDASGTLTPNALATEQAVPALAGLAFPLAPTSPASGLHGAGCPYWLVASDGGVFSYGARFQGALASAQSTAAVVGMAATPSGHGYWLATADGGVSAFGDATVLGLAKGQHLNAPVVGIAATPDGRGYWLATADGGVFSFGDATFLGSAGALRLNRPVVGIAAAPDGGGYWLVASDGGVFRYGDARFLGSAGALSLAKPVVGMAATVDGMGYWLVASDGGIFSYGDATFLGSAAKVAAKPVVGMTATLDGLGYWLVASDGGIFSYGDAKFFGSAGNVKLVKPIVAMAASAAPAGG